MTKNSNDLIRSLTTLEKNPFQVAGNMLHVTISSSNLHWLAINHCKKWNRTLRLVLHGATFFATLVAVTLPDKCNMHMPSLRLVSQSF